MRRSVGNRRGTRRAPPIRGGPSRFLAAFITGLLLLFLFGAVTAAAAAAHAPAWGPTNGDGRDTGDGRNSADRSQAEQERERDLLASLEARHDQAQDAVSTAATPPPEMTPTPPTTVPSSPPTTAPTPPTTLPAPVPATTPPSAGGSPGPPVAANTTTRAPVVPGALANATSPAAPQAVASGIGAPASGPAPQAIFPFPGPSGNGQVIRALRTAGPYGLLFALAGAVLVFLAVQGRVDRLDPRIARAPIDAHLDFQDLE